MTCFAKTSLMGVLGLVMGLGWGAGCKKSGSTDKTQGGTTAMSSEMRPAMEPAMEPTIRPADEPAMRVITKPVMTSAKMPIHLEEAYACTKADDCIRTCGQGIVNMAWHKKNLSRLQRCKDGCAGPRRLTIRCVNKVCTGFTADGKPDKHCTRKELRWNTP